LIYIAIRALNYRYIHIPIITNNYRKLPAEQLWGPLKTPFFAHIRE
jgi:hypothetical protein